MSSHKQTPQETPLRVPSTGKGKLRVGNPGNKGGGRTPDAIRATLRESFDKRINILHEIADDPERDDNTRIKALGELAKYGLGTTWTQTGDDGKAVPVGLSVRYVKAEELPTPDRLKKAFAQNGNGHKP